MAQTKEELLIKIQADTGNASESIALLAKQLGGVEQSLKGVASSSHGTESAVTGFGAKIFIADKAVEILHKSFEFLKETMSETIGEFLKSEDGYIRLGNTMRTVGEQDIKGALEAFKNLAETMQETTTVEDDQVIRLANVAKATGLSTEKTEELIKASADLAATGKTDLQGAFNALLKSLKGSTMGLSIMLPELTNMTKESAKAGDAVKYIRESLGGLAENELKTTSGQLIQAHNRFNDLKKGVGEVVAAFLGLHAGSNILNSTLGMMVEWLHHNKESLLEFAQSVHDGFVSFVDGIKGLYDGLKAVDWATIGKDIGAVGIALLATFAIFNASAVASTLTGVIAILALGVIELWAAVPALYAVAFAWTKNAIAMANVTVQYALVAAGIATIVAAVSLVIENFKELPSLVAAAFQAVIIGAGAAGEAILRAVGADDMADKLLTQISAIGDKFEKNKSVLKGGLVGDGIKELDKFKKAFFETLNAVTTAPSAVEDKRKPKTALVILSPEEKAAMDLRLKNYNDLKAQNAILDLDNRKSQMSTIDYLNQKYQLEINALRLKFKDGELGALGTKELEKQIELLGIKNDLAISKAPSAKFEKGQQAGEAAGSKFIGTLSSALGKAGEVMGGAVGSMSGMASSIGGAANVYMAAMQAIVSVVQGIIDFIPKIMDAIAGIFSSAADLPMKIVSSMQGIVTSMVTFTTDFIPGLLKMIPDLFMTIIDGALVKLPAAGIALMKGLPDMVMKLMDRIPEIVSSLITGIISSSPEIALALITGIIGNIPKLIVALYRATFITIPKAIIKGIVEGIKQIGVALSSMFGGNLFGKKKQKLEFDTKSITESMKKAAAALTGETSKLFKVMDLTGGDTTAAEKTKENISAIEAAGGKARDWMMQSWDKIVAGFNSLMTWFGQVWQQLLSSIKEVFSGVVQMFRDVFNAVKEIFNGIITGLSGVMDSIGELGKRIAQGVTDGLAAAGSFLGDLGAQIWQGLLAGLQGLPAFFTNMFNSLNPSNLFEKIFAVDYKGQGTVESALGINVPFMNFAKGGMVPGNAVVGGDSEMNDRVLAMVSPGEAVIPRSKMNNPFLSGLIKGVLDGTITPPKFKVGGVIGQAGSAISGAAQHAGGVIADEAQAAREFLARLAPAQLWDMVKGRVMKEMIPNMLAANKFHEGGIIGGSGDVPILGQAGEFVMQRSAVSGIGQGNLAQMNKTGSSSLQGNTSNVYNIDIKVDAKTAPDEKFIRGTMLPILKEELRRASLDGQRVLFQSGVRA